MTPLGERIRDMASDLCESKRTDAANEHVREIGVVEAVTGKPFTPSPYFSFLDGWDAAMRLKAEELNDENIKLHGLLIDLCTKMAVERCPHCKGTQADDELNPCPHCEHGWIEKPKEDAS
jgi:hypothetical protein